MFTVHVAPDGSIDVRTVRGEVRMRLNTDAKSYAVSPGCRFFPVLQWGAGSAGGTPAPRSA